MHKNHGGTDLVLRQQQDTKGFKAQKRTQNINEIMMKLEQDTPTKAGIWLETNDFEDRSSRRQTVRDKWWKTHKGEQAKELDTSTEADR